MAVVCPDCNHYNVDNANFCNHCGTKLSSENETTTNIVDETHYDDLLENIEEFTRSVDLAEQGVKVALYLPGSEKVIKLEGKSEFILGRKIKGTSEIIDIDFEPFHGYEKGVSRAHAKISLSGDLVTVTDLHSSNGTYVNQKRLMPNKSYTLAHGDLINLGSLILQYHNYNE